MPVSGFVSLIGAGPGDPGLLTLRGAEALGAADVIVYDHLANLALLTHARPEAERLCVGKKAGSHTLPQEEINALLIERARSGQHVARLKGGDPFVFGRGGEEALALLEAGIPYEIVPGVTSAVAVPAYAGIPVTHRGLASSFAVITGHEDPTKGGSALDWSRLATAADTLVLLMGLGNLPGIAEELVLHGRPADTPAAVVRWGTMPDQQTVSGTLADIAERAKAASLSPPAVLVVGSVVRLRERLRWFEERPLFGHRILVTRTRRQVSVLSSRLHALGAEAMELPTIETGPPKDWAPVDRAIAELSSYDWIVFTSVHGVAHFWERLTRAGLDARSLHGVCLAAIGPATAAELESHGVRADRVPDEYMAEAIVPQLGEVRGLRVLLPRADIARPALADLLREGGAEVVEVNAYRTFRPQIDCADLHGLLSSVTVATFTSSSTVRNLAAMARDAGLDLAQELAAATIACIGPITASTARDLGLPVQVVAEEYTIDGLVEALIAHVGNTVKAGEVGG